mgnify:CR=1 FL=1
MIQSLMQLLICIRKQILYKKLLKKGKEKYAYEIIELAREISEQ